MFQLPKLRWTLQSGSGVAETWSAPAASIDAQGTQSCIGRWANDGNGCTPVKQNNADLHTLAHKESRVILLYLRATQHINIGDEILLNYGPHYWCERPNK
jgi:hypothetical protein